MEIARNGEVHIRTANGTQWKLQEVRHVPSLEKNLISMSQIDSAGYTTVFGGGSWKVIKGAMIVAQGRKVGTLYMTSESRDTISIADSSVDSKLWHRRLGHMSEKGIKLLASKGKLPDLKSVDVGLCEDCIYGKHKRVSFSKFARTSKAEKLQFVHIDV